jgi:RNA polymerase sigma factor (sigma-70 family)
MPSQVNRPELKPCVIGLDALSRRQRRLVEHHMPLIYMTIERTEGLVRPGRVGREYRDLVQEGCLALADAVRCHDADRHGNFAAYAMARIRFTISRFAHEHAGAVRVPYIEQRRRRASRRSDKDRHDPGEPPRTVRWRDSISMRDGINPRRRSAPDETPRDESISDAVRARCRKAMSDAMDVLSQTRRSDGKLDRIIDECYQHRWSIPEPEARTSMRDLAKLIGCSPARINRLEGAFYRHTAACLEGEQIAGEASSP